MLIYIKNKNNLKYYKNPCFTDGIKVAVDFNANQTLERTARGIQNKDPNDNKSENLDKPKKKDKVEKKSESRNKKQKRREKKIKLNLKKKKSQKKTKSKKFEKNQEIKKSPGGVTEKIKKKNLQKSFSTRQAISDSCIKVRFE